VNALTNDGIIVIFQNDHAIILPGTFMNSFDFFKAIKSDGHYMIPHEIFELHMHIPHVHCLAHEPISQEILHCHLADSILTYPISMAHYMFGHQVHNVLGTYANVIT